MNQVLPFMRWIPQKNKHQQAEILLVIIAMLFSAGNVLGVGPEPLVCSDILGAVVVSTTQDLKSVAEDANNGAGTTFCLHDGVHRVTDNVVVQAGDTFIGELGAVISGAKELTNWTVHQQGIWKATVPGGILAHENGTPNEEGSPPFQSKVDGNINSEYVFFNDEMLFWTDEITSVDAKTFHIDYDVDEVYIGQDPTNALVEVGNTVTVFNQGVSDVTIKNLVFEKFATPAQKDRGIIRPKDGAEGWLVESNEFRLNHGRCVKGGPGDSTAGNGAIIRNNYFHHNGYQAIGGNNENGQIIGNEIAYTNTLDIATGSGAAGIKVGGTNNGLWEKNYVHDNFCNGIWIDVSKNGWASGELNIIRDNTVINNTRNGIHYEVSVHGLIEGNWVEGNGSDQQNSPASAGILISSSENVEVKDNIVLNNYRAITARSNTDRGNVDGIKVTNNVIAVEQGNRGQIGFWGDDPPPSTPSGSWVNLPVWDLNTYLLPDEVGANWNIGGNKHTFESWPYDAGAETFPMVATFEEVQTGGSSNSNEVASETITAVRNNLYLAAVSTKQFVDVDSVTGLGLTWTLVASQCGGRNQTGVEVWSAIGTPDASGPVTATLTNAQHNAVIAVSRYSGVDINNPIGHIVSANTLGVGGACSGGTDSSSYSVTLAGMVDGSIVYSAVGLRSRTHDEGVGYVERVDFNHGNTNGNKAGIGIQDQMISTSSSTVDVAVDGSFSSAVDWGVIGIEIKSAGSDSITFEEFQSGNASSSSSVSSDSITAANDHLYLAAISTKQFVEVDTVTGLGLTWTQVASQCGGRSQTGVEVWSAIGTPTASGPVTATLTGVQHNVVLAVSRYSGVTASAPIGSILSANTLGIGGACSGGTDSSTYNVTLSNVADGSVVYNAAALRSRNHTEGVGYSERFELHHGATNGDRAGLATQDKVVTSPSGPTDVTVDGSFSNNVDWGIIAIEIK